MFKKITSSFLVLTTFLVAANNTYIFEAKGKFAKEMKALVEKYSKDGKIEVKVYKKTDIKEGKSKRMTRTILSALSGRDMKDLKYADIEIGKKIYQERCARCHGINANESKYANARNLSTLKPVKIAELLKDYRDRDNFGGSTRFIMKPQADSLVTNEMQSVAVYIYSLNHNSDIHNKGNSTQDSYKKDANEKSSYLQ